MKLNTLCTMEDNEPGLGKKIWSFFIKDAEEPAPRDAGRQPAGGAGAATTGGRTGEGRGAGSTDATAPGANSQESNSAASRTDHAGEHFGPSGGNVSSGRGAAGVDVGPQGAADANAANSREAQTSGGSSSDADQTITNAAGTTQIDRKFTEHFVNLLEKANLPGPDYFEYKQALRSMDGLGLGEEKQFQAAWASFKAMGGAKETTVLKTSADQYLGVLKKDREAFLKDVDKALKDRVGTLQDEHKKLEEANAAYAQQILDLQKKIDDNRKRLVEISGEVSEQTARINTNRDSFEITYLSFVDQINADLSKINQYLH